MKNKRSRDEALRLRPDRLELLDGYLIAFLNLDRERAKHRPGSAGIFTARKLLTRNSFRAASYCSFRVE